MICAPLSAASRTSSVTRATLVATSSENAVWRAATVTGLAMASATLACRPETREASRVAARSRLQSGGIARGRTDTRYGRSMVDRPPAVRHAGRMIAVRMSNDGKLRLAAMRSTLAVAALLAIATPAQADDAADPAR